MKPLLLVSGVLLFHLLTHAQAAPPASAPASKPADDYSGTYSFLQDGEFLQVTVEDQGKVTGFVSRYGDTETDRGLFLDHFFKQGKLEERKLTFTTQTVHGVWYEFKGTIERGDGKKVGDEAYYVLKGTLTQYNVDLQQKTTSKLRDVVFKSFPRDMGDTPGKKTN
jgi:hypothetical protein